MDCKKCRKRSCRLSANHWRALFFAYGRKEEIVCHDFEPSYYHGIEGVFA